VETYATIFTIAPSPHDPNNIWTGSDDGYIQVTRNHGQTWTNVTPRDLPEFSRISMIEVSPHRPGTAYVAAKRYQLDDRAPYIFRTDDYGQNWVRTNEGIAPDHYVHVVREDPVRPGLLFAGTEHGVYVSFDNGTSWHPFNRNLPDVQVPDLVIKDNDLVIATHGRSAWIMNDISQLRQLDAVVASHDVHLFKPSAVQRGRDNAVNIAYSLKAPAERVTIEILDSNARLVRSFTATRQEGQRGGRGEGAGVQEGGGGGRRGGGGGGGAPSTRAGVNRFSWDLRYPGATTFDGLIMWAAGTNGPLALPGTYQVRLTVDDKPAQVQNLEIGKAARLAHVSIDELRAQFELATRVRDRTSEANEAVIAIRDIKSQVDDRVNKDGSVRQQGDALKTKFTDVEGEIYQYRNQSSQDPLNFPIKLNNKIAALMGAVEGVDGRPTRQSYEVFDYLSGQLDQQINRFDVLIRTDLEEFNRLLQSKGLEPVKAQPRKPVA
jgi:hypothetical protein